VLFFVARRFFQLQRYVPPRRRHRRGQASSVYPVPNTTGVPAAPSLQLHAGVVVVVRELEVRDGRGSIAHLRSTADGAGTAAGGAPAATPSPATANTTTIAANTTPAAARPLTAACPPAADPAAVKRGEESGARRPRRPSLRRTRYVFYILHGHQPRQLRAKRQRRATAPPPLSITSASAAAAAAAAARHAALSRRGVTVQVDPFERKL
jgi:hypothetical protein